MEWYVVGSVAALLTSFGFAPQVIKMWRTRAVRDVSPVIVLAGLLLYLRLTRASVPIASRASNNGSTIQVGVIVPGHIER